MAMQPALNSPFGNNSKDLPSPIPDAATSADLPVAPDLKGMRAPASTPAAPQPPAAAPAQAPDVGDYLDTGDYLSAGGSPAGQAPEGAPVHPLDAHFSGKEVNQKILGLDTRVKPDGAVEQFNKVTKKWEPISDTMRNFYAHIYRATLNLPGTAGAVAGGLVPGAGGLGIASRIASAMALGGGGRLAAAPSGANPREYVLRKAAGITNAEITGEDSILHPAVKTALLAGGIQGAGEALGGYLTSQEQKFAQQATMAKQSQAILDTQKNLSDAAGTLGIELRGDQAVRGLPGTADLTAKERAILSGASGEDQRFLLEQFNQQQKAQVAKAMDDVLKSVAPGVDFSQMDIQKFKFEGGKNVNFIDRIEQNYLQQLKESRIAALDVSKQAQNIDPQPILSRYEALFRDKLAFRKDLFDRDGNLNPAKLLEVSKTEGIHDRSMGTFIQSYLTLKNAVKREVGGFGERLGELPTSMRQYQSNYPAANAPEPGMVPTGPVGEGKANLDLKQVFSVTDSLQSLWDASKSHGGQFSGALGEVAHEAKLLEDEVIANVFQKNNQPIMAQRMLQLKDSYSRNIGDLRRLSNLIDQQPDNVAQVIFQQGPAGVNKLLSVASEKQAQEIRGAVLNNVYYDTITQSPGGNLITDISPDKFANQLFGTPVRKKTTEALFGEDAKRLETIANIAQTIKPSEIAGSSAKDEGALKRVLQIIDNMTGVSLRKAAPLIRGFFSKNPSAQEFIDTGLNDLVLKSEAAQANFAAKSASAKTAGKVVRKLGIPAAQSAPELYDLFGSGGNMDLLMLNSTLNSTQKEQK
jgi:hypothetical protein